jgi:hypothetical protein
MTLPSPERTPAEESGVLCSEGLSFAGLLHANRAVVKMSPVSTGILFIIGLNFLLQK